MSTYNAFLRVRHPTIDPKELTRVLGLEPAHAWAAGSPRGESKTGSSLRIHSESYWLAPLGESIWNRDQPSWPGPEASETSAQWHLPYGVLPLEAFLFGQIRLLTPHKEFFSTLSADGGSCELAVTMNVHDRWSINLPPPLLRSLAALNISLTIDVSTAEAASQN